MKRLFTSVLLLMSIVAFAATSYDFSSSIPSGWTSSAAPNGFETTGDARGTQFTTSSTLTLSGATDVASVAIVASSNIENGYELSVKVGNKSFGSAQSLPNVKNQTFTFTGEKTSGDIVLTITKTGAKKSCYIKTITVDGTATGGGDEPGGETDVRLDTNYVYAEPTILLPADSVGKCAIDMVQNNIHIACTNGALYATDIRAYANAPIVFTATKDMKAIVIDGAVKANFTATASCGTIQYESGADLIEAEPVLIVKDIDAKSITVVPSAQLQCKKISVYFDQNPDIDIQHASGDEDDEYAVEATGSFAFVGGQVNDMYFEDYGVVDFDLWTYTKWVIGDDGYEYADGDGTWMTVEFSPQSLDDMSGTYSIADGTLDGDYSSISITEGTDTTDIFFESGSIVVTRASDSTYNFTYNLVGDDGNTYQGEVKGLRYSSMGLPDYEEVNVEQAIAVGQALENNKKTETFYYVTGFATKCYEAKADTMQTFFMADVKDEGKGHYDFQAYNCYLLDGAVKTGDFVCVFGQIMKFHNASTGSTTIEIANGYAYLVEETALGQVFVPLNKDLPMYDMMGRQVDNRYRGVVIQEGRKYILF